MVFLSRQELSRPVETKMNKNLLLFLASRISCSVFSSLVSSSSSPRMNGPWDMFISSSLDSWVIRDLFPRRTQPCAQREWGSAALHTMTLQCMYTNWWSPTKLKASILKRWVRLSAVCMNLTVLSTAHLKETDKEGQKERTSCCLSLCSLICYNSICWCHMTMQNDISVNFTSIKNSMMNLVFIGHFFFTISKPWFTLILWHSDTLHRSCTKVVLVRGFSKLNRLQLQCKRKGTLKNDIKKNIYIFTHLWWIRIYIPCSKDQSLAWPSNLLPRRKVSCLLSQHLHAHTILSLELPLQGNLFSCTQYCI